MPREKTYKVPVFECQQECIMDISGYSHLSPEEARLTKYIPGRSHQRNYRFAYFRRVNKLKLLSEIRKALNSNPKIWDKWDCYMQGIHLVTEA